MINLEKLELAVKKYDTAYTRLSEFADKGNAARLEVDEARKEIAKLLSVERL